MKSHLKLLTTRSGLATYQASEDYATPNVTLIQDELVAGTGFVYQEYVAPVVSVSYSVGDVLWSDMSVTSSTTPSSNNVFPIGICCIATNDSGTNDGKARFVGLKYLTSSGPSVVGGESMQSSGLAWGPIYGDMVTGITAITDTFNDNDYNGESNTAAIVATNNLSSYPAAYACQQYAPTGTSAGDWYLPSINELKKLCNVWYNLDFSTLNANYPNDCIDVFNGYHMYWSSTWYINEGNYHDSACVFDFSENCIYAGNSGIYNDTTAYLVIPMIAI